MQPQLDGAATSDRPCFALYDADLNASSGLPNLASASSMISLAWHASSVMATLWVSTRRLSTSTTPVRYTKPLAMGMYPTIKPARSMCASNPSQYARSGTALCPPPVLRKRFPIRRVGLRPLTPQSTPKLYKVRHPERTLLYQTIAEHFETWHALASEGQSKQRSEPGSDKRGAKVDELHPTPLELIDRIAALVPPPRTHRHRYFGVLGPNSPLRAAVVAMAVAAPAQATPSQPAQTGTGVPGVVPQGNAVPPKRPAYYRWAVLIARIYEVFPLLCPMCGGQMGRIAFVTEGKQIKEIKEILAHIGVDSEPPHIAPARGPPLWEDW